MDIVPTNNVQTGETFVSKLDSKLNQITQIYQRKLKIELATYYLFDNFDICISSRSFFFNLYCNYVKMQWILLQYRGESDYTKDLQT